MATSDHDEKWQKKLLPFMTRMVALLALFFFLASFGQLIYLHLNIRNAPALNLDQSLSQLPSALPAQQAIDASRLKALVALEAHSVQRQYHQANVLLMARVWTSYLGFVTGMVLALVGAAFILGKLREPTSEVSGGLQTATVSLKSASPGLILAALGTMLMLATIITHHKIEVVQNALYLRDAPAASLPAIDPPKPTVEMKETPIRPTPKTDSQTTMPTLPPPRTETRPSPANSSAIPSLPRPKGEGTPTP